eukprot:14479461-Alexandrium_andersonii.AAC.1
MLGLPAVARCKSRCTKHDLSAPPANRRTQHPRTQRTDTVSGHCQSTNGTPDKTGHSEHRSQRIVRHLRGGSEAFWGCRKHALALREHL